MVPSGSIVFKVSIWAKTTHTQLMRVVADEHHGDSKDKKKKADAECCTFLGEMDKRLFVFSLK